MTSNVGAMTIKNQGSMGFGKKSAEATHEQMKERLKQEMTTVFRPEFINRLDDVVVFKALDKDDIMSIIDLELGKFSSVLAEHGVSMAVDQPAKDWLFGKGFNPEMGARPLRRAIELHLEDQFGEMMLRKELEFGSKVSVSKKEGEDKLSFSVEKPEKPVEKKPKPKRKRPEHEEAKWTS